MAKKIVKKAAAKKAPVKKVAAKRATVKPVVVEEVVVAAPACGCGCGKCGGFGRFLKKLIVFLVIFALGFVAAKFCMHHKMMPKFVNGCMDTSKIECPKMLAKVAAMDVDANGCITKQEFRAVKKAMWKHHKAECGK